MARNAALLSIVLLAIPVVATADNIDDAYALARLGASYPACAPITTDILDYPVNDPSDNYRWSGRNARVRAHAARVCTEELVVAKEDPAAIRAARGILIDECAALVKHGITLEDCATFPPTSMASPASSAHSHAASIVARFYQLLETSRWSDALALVSPTFRGNQTAAEFAAGYATTRKMTVNVLEQGSNTVSVDMRAVDIYPDGVKRSRTFKIIWTLAEEGGQLLMERASVKKLSDSAPRESVAVAAKRQTALSEGSSGASVGADGTAAAASATPPEFHTGDVYSVPVTSSHKTHALSGVVIAQPLIGTVVLGAELSQRERDAFSIPEEGDAAFLDVGESGYVAMWNTLQQECDALLRTDSVDDELLLAGSHRVRNNVRVRVLRVIKVSCLGGNTGLNFYDWPMAEVKVTDPEAASSGLTLWAEAQNLSSVR